MEFAFTDSKNKTFNLPVNPKEISLESATDDKTVDVVRLGQINIIGYDKLKSISLDFILPVETDGVHYLSTDDVLETAQDYLDKFNAMYKAKKQVRLVVTDTEISFKGSVTSFKHALANGFAEEYDCTIKLTEYKPHKALKVKPKKKKTAKKGKSRSKPPKKISRGSKVIVNGVLHRDSAGRGPGVTERNATRKISIVNSGAKYPYHVTTLNGGARGWVSKSAVKAV